MCGFIYIREDAGQISQQISGKLNRGPRNFKA